MENMFTRTEMIFGKSNMEKLKNSHIAVFGLGGVGSFVVEALVRAGIGNIDIIDNDIVSKSNLNRQLIATIDTIGKNKVDVMEERIKSINANCNVKKYKLFFLPGTSSNFDFSKYDYVVDAIDTVTGKLEIIKCAKKENVKVISCMGTGNKVNPCLFEIDDIYNTKIDPLCKVMRKLCKDNNIDTLKVLYSKEKPILPNTLNEKDKRIPASVSFVPSVAGLIIAGEVIKDLLNFFGNGKDLS